jgi:hypothetical protein
MGLPAKLMLLAVLLSAATAVFADEGDNGDVDARGWDIRLKGLFADGTKPLIIYTREQNGEWLGCVGSSRDPAKDGRVRKTYNMSWYYVDLSTVPIKDGKVKGKFKVYFTPDLWIPTDHKPFHAVFEIDATVNEKHQISGEWKLVDITSDDQSVKNWGKKGKVNGWSNPKEPLTLPEELTLQLNFQSALIGGDPSFGNRCMVVWVSADGGEIVSLSHGLMSKKRRAYQRTPVDKSDSKVTITDKKFSGKVQFPAKTLDMEPCTYVYEFEGRYLNGLAVGKYKATVTTEDGTKKVVEGSFDGKYRKGVDRLAKPDNRPWFKEVKGFEPPKAGEHPRLLFRESDIPELRKKAKTPEGKAILKRLRYLLNGSDGETMTKVFSDATHAYMGGGYKSKKVDTPGAYTIGHAAGYGLLYQLTGEEKYAKFGKECFERALNGQRDRDDRYSFRKPGGALRAGPSLGWYAVGYDLIYDALDKKTRAKFTKAIAEYSEGEEGKEIDLEALARGTMPPSSNHFGMQVGGASLALLAIRGEEGVDNEKIDTLLKIARQSMVRNMSQGFGNGGFFAEGDGTGSMSSQIAFISALQAWKNAAGLDFVNVERPNARMMTLKWVYQTVVRNGRPDFWPIRGSYGHNVWSRKGMSGAGYFAIGLGGVTDSDRAAMKHYYQEFLADHDARKGQPYDTASVYPQVAVSSLVNWPTKLKAKQPEEVLPRCFRDSHWGFYAWRNRWKNENDTVITVLLRRTSGYMAAKSDKALEINSMGKHFRWGTVKGGKVKHWSHSKMGETSSLTLDKKGIAFGVDFTHASGADVLLVTTGKAKGTRVKLGKHTLTFSFPTAESDPEVKVKDGKAIIGKQAVSLDKDGNIVFAVQGK